MIKKFLFGIVVMIAACTSKREATQIDPVEYAAGVEAWHQERVDELKGPKGWLNIAGLYWLDEGINTFGSGEKNNVVFPAGTIPELAGTFFLKQNTVTMNPAGRVEITSSGKPLKNQLIYHPDSARIMLSYGTLEWFIIKRDTKYGVRLRNFKNPAIESFKGIERFPVDISWRLEGQFEKADAGKTIPITNVLGQTSQQPSPGTVVFTLKDKEYRLDVIDEGKEKDYFLIFGDPTNTKETYGAGRFLYIPREATDGTIVVDFNHAENPPCAFTEFATCPLPPKQNVMDVEVTAGEKNYGDHRGRQDINL